MPNIFLSSGVKFNPFTYDELVKPLDRLYQEHSKIEEGLSELQVKAGIWEGLANQQSDPETYAQYKRYADELRLAANDLAINGLNATSRQNLFNMKARYASEITPIEQAYQRRDELEREQRRLKVQDPSLMFDNDFSTVSLDKLRSNPRLSYSGISGTAISAKASGMLNNLAKGIESDPQYENILNGQYFQAAQRTGLTTAQVLALSQNNPEALYAIAKARNNGVVTDQDAAEIENIMRIGSTIRSTIHDSLRGNSAYADNIAGIDAAINEGFLTSGVGGINYSTMHDLSYVDPGKAASIRASDANRLATLTRLGWEQEDRENAKNPIPFDDGTFRDPSDETGGKYPYRVVNGKRIYQSGTTGSKSGSSSSGGVGNTSRLDRPVKITVQGTYTEGKGVSIGPKGADIAVPTYYDKTTDINEGNLPKSRLYAQLSYPERLAVSKFVQPGQENDYNYHTMSRTDGTREIYVIPRDIGKETSNEYQPIDENAH